MVASVAVPLGSGFISGFLTRDEVKGWYKDLKKPQWNPPNWLFGPAWSVFYTTMGIASWLVWRSGEGRGKPLALYGAQLALNLAWTPLFFKGHALDLALVDITALLGLATAATVKMAQQTDKAAVASLMAPYLAWVTFATALNGELLRLNPKETAIDYSKLKKDAKKSADKAATKAKETGAKVVAKAEEVKKEAGAKAAAVKQTVSHAATEVAKKAQEDTAALAGVVREAVAAPPAAPAAPAAPRPVAPPCPAIE